MEKTAKRIVGYGVTGVVLGGLIWSGFIRDVEADAMTLLGAASVQLQLANSFPTHDKLGEPNEARTKLLEDVGDMIRRARRQEPDLHSGFELEAHLNWMSGDYRKAAELFHDAQGSRGATPETGIIDRLNEARMLRAAKSPEQAIHVLDTLSEFLVKHATESQIQRAHVLFELGRKEESVALAGRIARSTTDSSVLVEAALILESQDETVAAEAALGIAAESQPLANYYLARLKIRAKEFDTGVDLLKRAVAADGRRVKNMLKHDSDIWQPVHDDERFQGLFASPNKAAPPGR